ncbi:MAG: hypothetical protein B7Z07_03620 [Sphingomonadales bacterium 32-67-7]|nr:MAG: hypothetical protein B7Z07_03620 [Sphingomonadales bacterium 32-67-7]
MNAPKDPVDHIMEVMEGAFDPAFGEAWTRRQVSDALVMGNCRHLLLDADLQVPDVFGKAAGFTLSREAAGEEELLLIAVLPDFRRMGVASALMERLIADARMRGVTRMFLEMRDGNPAEALYLRHGFEPVGRRPNYYNRGSIAGIDAITFALGL